MELSVVLGAYLRPEKEHCAINPRAGEFFSKAIQFLMMGINILDVKIPGFREMITAILMQEESANETLHPFCSLTSILESNDENKLKLRFVMRGMLVLILSATEEDPEIKMLLIAGSSEELDPSTERGDFILIVEQKYSGVWNRNRKITIGDLPIFPFQQEEAERQLNLRLGEFLDSKDGLDIVEQLRKGVERYHSMY